ncbi:short-chain dehydrogenase/reductase [Streptomyces sp. NPDC057257]|uniref:short-chain dehydrogenase/reductase n=1 Tax=Streptomyces sp. NPDC057257 TaxID=3346071 RepID=UPI0036291B23
MQLGRDAAPHPTLRTHTDPSRDGSDVVSAVADRVRADFFADFFRRNGLDSLLTAGSSL